MNPPDLRLAPIRCPKCGQPARGTVETLAGCAEFSTVEDDGAATYSGYTEVWWDEQRTEADEKGRVRLVCPDAHEWWAVDRDAVAEPEPKREAQDPAALAAERASALLDTEVEDRLSGGGAWVEE